MQRLLVVITLVACGDREAPPLVIVAPPVVVPDAAAPEKPVDRGPLSAEPPVWPDAAGPSSPVAFKRNFKKPGSWLYDYRQNMTMTASVGPAPSVSAVQAKGTLTVESKRDGNAVASLSAEVTSHEVGEPPDHAGPLTMELPLDETGTVDTVDSETAMVALLLPVPTKPMKIGDTDAVRFRLPITGNLFPMSSVSGPLTFKLVGYSKIGSRTCARFDTSLAIEEKRGGSHVKMTVAGKVCIDPADGAVVASFLAIDMKIASGGADPMDMSFAGVLGLDRI
jgi:hypothetical protein